MCELVNYPALKGGASRSCRREPCKVRQACFSGRRKASPGTEGHVRENENKQFVPIFSDFILRGEGAPLSSPA